MATPRADNLTTTSPSAELVKGLGLFDCTTIVMGSMIGSGIFIVAAEIAREVGSPGLFLLSWVISGVMTVSAAVTYGELAAMMPKAGGQYVYLREAFSPLFGFLYGWTLFLVIQTGTIAAVAVAFGKFLGFFFPWISEKNFLLNLGSATLFGHPVALTFSTQQGLAVVVLLGLGVVNIFGLRTGAWILPDERPLPAELEAFLDAGTPPVYVGFGSMRAPKDIARVAIEAIRALGRRALVSRGWAGLALIDDRDDCFAVGEVNQQALFGRVAAVVHHGGAGTTTAAARVGAPQVVVPQMADQPYWAGRVAGLGIGTAHDGPAPTTGSLSAAIRTALTPRPAHERPPWPARSAPTGRRWPRHCCSTRSAGKGRQCLREPPGIAGPGPRTREPANPGDLNRQRPRGRRQAERCLSWPPGSSRRTGRLPHAAAASELRSELMP